MKNPPIQKRTLALAAVLIPLVALFFYVAVRSGPLAPVPVTVATVENKSLSPALFGIGAVEARYTYKIGPTFAGRVKRLDVQVGDRVRAGQVLGEMAPVDLDERIRAQDAALGRARAQLVEAEVRESHARLEARRYELLRREHSTSEEIAAARQQELRLAQAGLEAARQEFRRAGAEREAMAAQRADLRLLSPVDGLVVKRDAEPGSTVVAGQTVVECIDPASLWLNVRFDQIRAQGLAADLPARIVLRSQAGEARSGRVLRVEPLADQVTEETMAKVVFDVLPSPLPPVGELAEVTVLLPAMPAGPVIANAAVHRRGGGLGVWKIVAGEARFSPVTLGIADLDGQVRVLAGLVRGEQVVVYSEKALNARLRIRIVDNIAGGAR
ncbi:efflux RND transporter periplasmic adaptor subunit [Thiovibrio sp. JS02]